ncbi:MAG: hypothetical protein WB661_06225 [Candidatus Bathyarchaeia archaeon]
MALDVLLESVNVLSALATAALVVLTSKPTRASGVPYLLAIPAGFGLITVAFIVQIFQPFLLTGSPLLASPVQAVWLLTQTYGMLFIAFAYAKRTRLRLLGESTTADLLTAALVTMVFLAVMFAASAFGTVQVASTNAELFLRAVIMAATVYIIYETLRNWSQTRKASLGFVTIGFAFFLIEQLGFILALGALGSVAVFLAYEGRIVGLFVLNALLIVGVRTGDLVSIMKRLGLAAPAHYRATPNLP